MEEIRLNQRVLDPALKNNRRLMMRIEDCIINARTETSKRRLFQTALALSVIAAANISFDENDTDSFVKIAGDIRI